MMDTNVCVDLVLDSLQTIILHLLVGIQRNSPLLRRVLLTQNLWS